MLCKEKIASCQNPFALFRKNHERGSGDWDEKKIHFYLCFFPFFLFNPMLFVCLSSLVACISQTLWPCPPPHSLSRTPWAPDSLFRHLQFLLSTFLLVHPLSIDLLGEITCLSHIRSEYNAHVANSLLVLFTILKYNKVPVKVHLTRCLSPLCYICSEKKTIFSGNHQATRPKWLFFITCFPYLVHT